LVDVNTADANSFVTVVFIEKSEIIVALGEKLENSLGTSSSGGVSVLNGGVFDFEETEDGDYYVMLIETAEEVVEAFFEEIREGFKGLLELEFLAMFAVGGKVFLLVFLIVGVKIFFSVFIAFLFFNAIIRD
jgi:hypothetical protein